MITTSKNAILPLVVVHDAVVGGEMSDRQQPKKVGAGGAEAASPTSPSPGPRDDSVEDEEHLFRRGRAARLGASGRSASSSACSASRISRARRRAPYHSLEPLPSIPTRFTSTSTPTPNCTPAPRINVTRTRAVGTLTSAEGRSGEEEEEEEENRRLRSTPLTSNSQIGGRRGHPGDATGVQGQLLLLPGHLRLREPIPTPTPTPIPTRPNAPKIPRSLSFHAESNSKSRSTMSRSVAPDLFFELAGERENENHPQHSPFNVVHTHRRSMSRTSNIDKRRSLPPDLMPRPSTSGGIGTATAYNHRPSPRLQHVSRASTDLQRHMDQYNNRNRMQVNEDDNNKNTNNDENNNTNTNTNKTSSARHRRTLTAMADRSPLSPKSPETPQYGRRRPSFGVMSPRTQESQDVTPTDQKATESTSSDSQSVDTVWDELDDLKSRIKKLELTGKLPPTSSAAISGGSSDRPRTATTAPTTIDSSPKRGLQHDQQQQQQQPPPPPTSHVMSQPDTPTTPAGLNISNIHPLLHNALAKAKPLLNSNLFRSLEATASDALQLAAMTGSAGPQGTTFSAASIINGVTVSDRHVRRKADNMCRNLTDLCLALCEGKHEAPTAFSSPSTAEPVLQRSPSLRYARSGMGSANTIRPASRLEARRSSILGAPHSIASDLSPRGSIGDMSNYDQEQSPPQQSPHSYLQAPQRTSRTPSSRFRSRLQSHDSVSGNEDEDHTVRPLSRAMTDAGSFRARPRIISESRTPGTGQHRISTSSLRDSIVNSRTNEDVFEQNRRTSFGAEPRYSSDSTTQRKRQSQLYNTPPTVTEEADNTLRGGDFQSTLQSRRRVTTQQQYSSQRAAEAVAMQRRSGEGGLQQRRHLAME